MDMIDPRGSRVVNSTLVLIKVVTTSTAKIAHIFYEAVLPAGKLKLHFYYAANSAINSFITA